MTDFLYQFVIYKHPSDFPEHFVVRRWRIGQGGLVPDPEPLGEVDNIDDARALVPHGLVNLGRMPDDDPIIFEVWT